MIAAVLNRGGRRTGKGNRWTRERVLSSRKQHGIAGQQKTTPDPETLSLIGAARHCRVRGKDKQGTYLQVVESAAAWAG